MTGDPKRGDGFFLFVFHFNFCFSGLARRLLRIDAYEPLEALCANPMFGT